MSSVVAPLLLHAAAADGVVLLLWLLPLLVPLHTPLGLAEGVEECGYTCDCRIVLSFDEMPLELRSSAFMWTMELADRMLGLIVALARRWRDGGGGGVRWRH